MKTFKVHLGSDFDPVEIKGDAFFLNSRGELSIERRVRVDGEMCGVATFAAGRWCYVEETTP